MFVSATPPRVLSMFNNASSSKSFFIYYVAFLSAKITPGLFMGLFYASSWFVQMKNNKCTPRGTILKTTFCLIAFYEHSRQKLDFLKSFAHSPYPV